MRKKFLCLNEKSFIVFLCVFFLCTIQRREISLIFARVSPLATKFCTKTKTKRTTFLGRVCHWIKKKKKKETVSL